VLGGPEGGAEETMPAVAITSWLSRPRSRTRAKKASKMILEAFFQLHIFKASAETYESVISNQKHAFANSPQNINPGDIIVLSKNKSGLQKGEKQISHYAILSKIRRCTDQEIEELWPGNNGRWKYITDFLETRRFEPAFNLEEILPADRTKHYSSVMTHARFSAEDESIIKTLIEGKLPSFFPEEIVETETYCEGGSKKVTVNAYERDPRARRECLRINGFLCSICDYNFEATFGEIGRGYIHVHHVVPLHIKHGSYQVDPQKDLIPVCPNCHAMLHRTNPPLKPHELKEIYLGRKNG
jgi:hypothetical protein